VPCLSKRIDTTIIFIIPLARAKKSTSRINRIVFATRGEPCNEGASVMRSSFSFAFAAIALAAAAGPTFAVTITDPINDYLPSYAGLIESDLDLTSFTVSYNAVTQVFTLGGTVSAVINPANKGQYFIGVNTGAGAFAPFASIGQPLVAVDQAVIINQDGTGSLNGMPLALSDISISGNSFSANVALILLPTTGATADHYQFSLWSRASAILGNLGIADFAPENALLSIAPVPEAGTWGMAIVGLGAVGVGLRRRRRAVTALA
jgi:PEP-CTERM motif